MRGNEWEHKEGQIDRLKAIERGRNKRDPPSEESIEEGGVELKFQVEIDF